MKFLMTLILFVMGLSIQAQTFQELIKRGDSLYQQEYFLESAKAYQNALEVEEGTTNEYYNAACSWALAGNSSKSLYYLCLAAEKGWDNLSHLDKDPDLISLHALKDWKTIREMVKENIKTNQSDLDLGLKTHLEDIYVKDQTLRWLIGDAESKFGNGSDHMDYYWSLISKQDSINEIQVIDIINKNGWVGIDLVGEKANKALWLVIQHSPIEVQEKFLPLLKESVKLGKSNGSHLALLEDRILMRNGKPQVYGSQVITDKETGEKRVYEIKDPEYINQRRKSVGLGPIENYLETWNIKWTVKQKEK